MAIRERDGQRGVRWTRPQLLLALHLYVRTPFGKQHSGNPEIRALAERMGRTPGSVAMKLNNFTSLDPIEAARGISGLKGASTADQKLFSEFLSDPVAIAAEAELEWQNLAGAGPSGAVVSERVDPPEEIDSQYSWRGATERRVEQKVRLAQGFFRSATLAAYDEKCCITGLAIPALLIASHIRPWAMSAPGEQVLPSNGLCLSRLHDGAFDRGLITLDEQHRVVLSQKLRAALNHDAARQAFEPYEGRPITMPNKYPPDPECLEFHRTHIFKG